VYLGALALWQNFSRCKILAFAYIGSITAGHSSSGLQPNFAASYKEWNYGTDAQGATYIWQGSHRVLVSVINATRSFSHFSCTHVDNF